MSVNRHPNTQGVTIKQWRYTATGGETTLSGTDGFSQSLTYTAGAEEVFINGVLLVRGTDYTATNGTTVVLNNALVAGDIATVSAPSVFNVANTVPLATVAAKGDLIVGNGAASVTNLGVGADGSTLVANSSASTGVSWAGPIATAGKNFVLNGGMDIWQRGTSVAFGTSIGYAADRWAGVAVSPSAQTVTRQPTSDTTNLPNIQYCARVQRNSGNTSTNGVYLYQSFETVNSIPLAGQKVVFSFWARIGANFSAASNNLSAYVYYGTGTDQQILSGLTGQTTLIGQTVQATTGWVRYTGSGYVGTLPTTATQIAVGFQYNPTGTAGTNDYFEVTGVQLEIGSVATPFQRNSSTLQGELAACMRYYQYISPTGTYQDIIAGSSNDQTTFCRYPYKFPIPMRTAPTLGTTGTASDYANLTASGFNAASSVPTINNARTDGCVIYVYSGGISTGQGTSMRNSSNYNQSTWLTFNAEL